MYSPILILMWRHFVVRVHKFISTIVEFASVMVLVLLFLSSKSYLFPKDDAFVPESDSVTYHLPELIPLEAIPGPSGLVFLPYNKDTAALMEKVAKEFNLPWIHGLPGNEQRGYYGLSNKTIAEEFMRKMSETQAVVIFKNTENDLRHLDYEIRVRVEQNQWSAFDTSTYKPKDGNLGPHEVFGTVYEPFMRLQWAIDKSYLELRTSVQNIKQDVVLQMFPYEDVDKKQWVDEVAAVAEVVCLYSLFLPFVLVMARLVEERVTGVQELIKMAGVSKLTLMISHFLNCVPVGLLYAGGATGVFKRGTPLFLPNTSGSIVFLMLLLHYISIITLAMLCSFITNRKRYSVTLATILFVAVDLPGKFISETEVWLSLRVLSCLLPNAALHYFWVELSFLEKFGKGVNSATMTEAFAEKSISVMVCLIMSVVQICVYGALVAYLMLVRPGPYGSPLPWNFLWKKRVTPARLADDREPVLRDPRYMEPAPVGKEVGIRVTNVTKIYGKDIVLNNVTLDIYKGEITVLLGHNGAGKTTLMNVITGMTAPTEGSVEVNGVEGGGSGGAVQRDLGLCPQHNMFLPALTVTQHVIFFAMLKGQSYREAVASSKALLIELGLEDKANAQSNQLSGGMQRRLQLACALSGGASVLVLDEPTSGLDVETRRDLWDLLLNLRGRRTVVISTHFMEEADALGDRVAALHAGALACYATPIFLKSHVGTGYILTISTIGAPREAEITSAIIEHVPEAKLRAAGLKSVTYNLPTHCSNNYPKLFKSLESQRSALGIDTIGLGMSTLEEVFVKLCSNVDTSFAEEEQGDVPDNMFKLVRPPALYWRQLKALLKRQMLFLWANKFSFFIFQVILPILFIFLTTHLVNSELFRVEQAHEMSLPLTLDIYKDIKPRIVYYDVADKDTIEELAKSYTDVLFIPSGDIVTDVMRLAETDFHKYRNLIAGIKLNDTIFQVFYTTSYRHAAGVALNLASNAALRLLDPQAAATGSAITARNFPVMEAEMANRTDIDDINSTVDVSAIVMWVILILIVFFSSLMNVVSLLVRELKSGTRRLHTMAGCPSPLQWASRIIFHMFLYTLILIVPIAIALRTFRSIALLAGATDVIMLVLILGLVSWLSLMYALSFRLGEGAVATALSVMMIAGIILACVRTLETMAEMSIGGWLVTALTALSSTFLPSHRVASAMIKIAFIASKRRMLCSHPELSIGGEMCNKSKYFGWNKGQVSNDILALGIQFVVYMTLVLLLEEGLLDVVGFVYSRVYKPRPRRYNDSTVKAEALYVEKAIEKPAMVATQDVMLVNDIHKTYLPMFKRPVHSVNGISLSVKKGECFGLLGVNGAGKSTTFKTMVAEVAATRGSIWANGHHLKFPRRQYLQSLSYCPQFLGVDAFLTGWQNLAFLLTMRGLNDIDIEREVEEWIRVVGLERLQHMAVRMYSGGCARRVSAASALCAAAPLTLLDEPTAGVDVAARRRVWTAIRRALRASRAVVLSSHSMDEMEALCARIAILSKGEVCALGTPPHLRAAHAKGHALRLKIASSSDANSTTRLNALKLDLEKTFTCKLKDEHKTMLLYHIDETLPYSELFALLEGLKTSHDLIEDYTVSETTLEEVFLSFAHDAHKTTVNGAGDAV